MGTLVQNVLKEYHQITFVKAIIICFHFETERGKYCI